MLQIKVIVVGAVVFFALLIGAFFFLLPGIQRNATSVGISEEASLSMESWKSARPFSLSKYMQRGSDLMLILKNESETDLVITKTCVDLKLCQERDDTVRKGETVIRLIPIGKECELGETFNYPAEGIVIEYSENGSKKVQNGVTAITGNCS